MRMIRWITLALIVGLAGCSVNYESKKQAGALTDAQRSEVEEGVRRFVSQVARDVTREGPVAWRKEFSDGPEFFMVSDGQLAFASGQAAAQGMDGVAKMIKHIELHWEDDLKIDALTPELAVVGTSWQEVRDLSDGHQLKDSGYFTGLVEKRNGEWRFRDAHWSTPKPVSSVQ